MAGRLGRLGVGVWVARVALDRGWIEDSPRVEDAVRTNLGRALESFSDLVRPGRGLYQYVAHRDATEP